jgi:hypothetical protein
MIHRFCVSHEKPLLPERWYDDCISVGDFQTDSAFHVRQLDHFWHDARPIAYGAAGVYVLPIAIERFCGDADLIEISSYRKRTLPFPEGRESRVYPTMRELSLENFKKEAELSEFRPRTGVEFLVAQPLHVKNSIIGNYAAVHHRRDILDYAALAVELGVLDTNSASEFLATKYFIPAGIELGIYPRSWIVEALSKIEVVGRRFLTEYGTRVERYNRFQIRAVGFLGERLGSFLLIRHLMDKYSNNIPADIFGYMTTIVEGSSGYSAGLADRHRNRLNWHRPKHKEYE